VPTDEAWLCVTCCSHFVLLVCLELGTPNTSHCLDHSKLSREYACLQMRRGCVTCCSHFVLLVCLELGTNQYSLKWQLERNASSIYTS
jgi:hypothetical protein